MPNGDSNLAQAIYLAQLYAARGECDCKACQLMRGVTEAMMAQMLRSSPIRPSPQKKGKPVIPGAAGSPGGVPL